VYIALLHSNLSACSLFFFFLFPTLKYIYKKKNVKLDVVEAHPQLCGLPKRRSTCHLRNEKLTEIKEVGDLIFCG